MKFTNLNEGRLNGILFGLLATGLAFLGSVSLNVPYVLQLGLPILLGLGVYGLFEVSLRREEKDNKHSRSLLQLVAALVLALILASTYTATKSLWYSPLDANWGDRFIYENIATGVGFAAIVLTFVLSALQKDIYWVTRKKTVTLDERQLKERQQVFETSYKLGAFIVLYAAWFFAQTIHNMPAIMANSFNAVPGHLYWLPFNVALLLFALPLVVAAWKKR